MPLEGQWERQHTPLRPTSRREFRTLLAVAAVLLVGAVAITVVAVTGGLSTRTAPGCIDITTASSLGGTTLHSCGADARQWCTTESGRTDSFARVVQQHCRKAGYLPAG